MKRLFLLSFVMLVLVTVYPPSLAEAKSNASDGTNAVLTRRLINEAWNQRKIPVVDEILAADCRYIINGVPLEAIGPLPMKQDIEENWQSSDKFEISIDDLFEREDKAVLRYTIKKRPKQSDQEVAFHCIAIVQFAQGKIVKLWYTFDRLGVLLKLGYKLLPPSQ